MDTPGACRLLGGLLLSPRRALDAAAFLAALPARWDCVGAWRARAQQQDAAEFGHLLLDQLEHELQPMPPPTLTSSSTSCAAAAAAAGGEGMVARQFGGCLHSVVGCLRCGRTSRTRETMEVFSLALDLLIDPPRGGGGGGGGGVGLGQMLAMHFAPEELAGDGGAPIYSCAHCGGGGGGESFLRVHWVAVPE
eukprot:COSAG01_NODE_24936_length_761_cov_1.000000_1_plen_192_part_10